MHLKRRWKPAELQLRLRRICFVLAVLIFLLLCLAGYRNLVRLITVYGRNNCKSLVTQAILEAADEARPGERLTHRHDSGEKTILELDGSAVRNYQAEVGQKLNEKLSALEDQSHQVALGTILGNAFLMDRGPRIALRFVPVSNAAVAVKSSLHTAGVNQVLYQVTMEIRVNVTVLLPGRSDSVVCEQKIVLEETLVSGNVPLVYSRREEG